MKHVFVAGLVTGDFFQKNSNHLNEELEETVRKVRKNFVGHLKKMNMYFGKISTKIPSKV